MGHTLILASVALILALSLSLVLQLWLYLPRTWRGSPLGQIVSLTLVALGGWLVSWLGLALALALLEDWWGVVPRPQVLTAINVALIGSLIAILAAGNIALGVWRWKASRPVRLGGIE